jgi:hypothetical protein
MFRKSGVAFAALRWASEAYPDRGSRCPAPPRVYARIPKHRKFQLAGDLAITFARSEAFDNVIMQWWRKRARHAETLAPMVGRIDLAHEEIAELVAVLARIVETSRKSGFHSHELEYRRATGSCSPVRFDRR